jgi:hypothetical protein
MSRERNAAAKAIIWLVLVIALTALLAYFLHFRPAEDAATSADTEQVVPR